MLEGVGWARVRHLFPLIVETDYQALVEALHSSSLDSSILGFLLSDLKESLNLALNVRVLFFKRESNLVAHVLAQIALLSHVNPGFSLVIPPHMEVLISSDCDNP